MKRLRVKTVRKVSRFLRQSSKRKNLLVGGRGSGKSWGVMQFLLFRKFYRERGIRILVCRKTLPSLRTSAYQLIMDTLYQHGLPFELNKNDMVIRNGPNEILFRPLDDVQKIKSIERINYIWVEEATEISAKDYLELNLCCRGPNPHGPNQVFYTFNPVDFNSFLKPITESPPKDTAVNWSTFRDNLFLTEAYINQIKDLVNQDDAYYRIYTLGLWAALHNLIYKEGKHWDIVPTDTWPEMCETHRFALDFGFASSKAALVELKLTDGEVWERQHFYQTHLTTPEIIDRLKEIIPPARRDELDIIADSARPEDIQEIFDAGFNIYGCIKGPGSVKTGIDRVRSKRVHVLDDSQDIIAEKRGYKWKEDKNGNVLPAVVKYKDDLLDAERYGISYHEDTDGPELTSVVVKKQKFPKRGNVLPVDGDKEVAEEQVDEHREHMLVGETGWS